MGRKLIKKYPIGSLVLIKEPVYISISPSVEITKKYFGLITDVDKTSITILFAGKIVKKKLSEYSTRIKVCQRLHKKIASAR